IRNSYAVDVMNNYTFFETNHISGRYLVILIESKIELPDLIIRPSTMADKVSNLLLHFDIKLDNRPKFNAEYILESGATKPVCESLLTPELTSVIEKQKDFCLEIRESRILIKYQHEMQLEESMNLLAIGKLLDYIIKNKS
ncbi:MAG TPA: hypothetical protein VG847_09400, partial [Chitinophagaceae bacterium]|nr:hypothetical protein [Chitinophagaceae bacterium]